MSAGSSAPQRGAGALEREVAEVLVEPGEAVRNREVGQRRLAELDRDVGTLGDPQRVVARLGMVAEEVAHLVGGLEVVLGALELEPLRIGQHRLRLHAQQHVVRLVVVAMGVMRVVRREQRRADAAGELDELRVGASLFGEAMVLQLDEQVVLAEDVLQARRLAAWRPRCRHAAAPGARARRGIRWWR